ncbi:rod shape-determining protein MreD [Pontiellaceae bacterium B12227]|nr:rod shape-determining protein MreD [Pontiellaceae bacterium B12227]
MRHRLLMLTMILFGALLQMVLPTWPLFGGMKPPILAALVLHYSLRRDNREMWLAVFTAALMQDGLELGSFGPALLAFPIIGILANRIRTEVFADGLVSQVIFGAVIGLFFTFITLLIFTASGQRPFSFGLTLLRLLGSFILGMVTLPLVSHSIIRLEGLIPKRRTYGWQ